MTILKDVRLLELVGIQIAKLFLLLMVLIVTQFVLMIWLNQEKLSALRIFMKEFNNLILKVVRITKLYWLMENAMSNVKRASLLLQLLISAGKPVQTKILHHLTPSQHF